MLSPILSVPFCTMRVATGPLPFSKLLSMTTARAGLFGLAFSSKISAWSKIVSNKSSIPSPVLAEICTNSYSPPHSSGVNPSSAASALTLSVLASGLSILFTAMIIGAFAAFAWFSASIV